MAESKVEIVDQFQNIYRRNASNKFELDDLRLEVQNSHSLINNLEDLMKKENQEIVLISPYLWMSEKQIHLIKAWLLADPNRRLTAITNSMMTSDNVLAQVLVDSVIGPELALDAGLKDGRGRTIRRSVADQVRIYERGHTDAIDLGGKVPYGKLHTKAVYLRSSKTSIVGTYNNDPRSRLLNSEGAAVVQGAEVALKMEAMIDSLIIKSHLWGSDEYHAIRADAHMPLIMRKVSENLRWYYSVIMKLNIWWMI